MSWTRRQAQDHADSLAVGPVHTERAIREIAARAAESVEHKFSRSPAEAIKPPFAFIGGTLIAVLEQERSVREVALTPPASWGGDPLVLQLVFEAQIREQLAASESERRTP